MTDVNTRKPIQTQPEYYAGHGARHRLSEIRLSDTQCCLSSNVNCLYFIITVK